MNWWNGINIYSYLFEERMYGTTKLSHELWLILLSWLEGVVNIALLVSLLLKNGSLHP